MTAIRDLHPNDVAVPNATVFSKFIDSTKLKLVISDDPRVIERQLR